MTQQARQFVQNHLATGFVGTELDNNKALKASILSSLKQLNAVMITHYYTSPEVQALTEETGGCVGDSLEMARFGAHADADIIIVNGVRFMGETAKILSPQKRVFMPTLEATCSLDLGCDVKAFSAFCDHHPDREIVVYANTSAAVKARADWVVTSSTAVKLVDYLHQQGKKILWAPDRFLGDYVQKETGADMLLWDASCIVHEEFKAKGIKDIKAVHPDAAVLVHPESPAPVIQLADCVGSTTQIINASKDLPHDKFIVATDRGIFYKMTQQAPEKEFYLAPTAGNGANCKSCGHCPWMAMNTLTQLDTQLESLDQEVLVDKNLIPKALKPLNRLLAFAAENL